jgi:hypothetical protein
MSNEKFEDQLKKTIVFYNNRNNGDLFYPKECIRNIINANNEFYFKYAIKFGDSIYEDFTNVDFMKYDEIIGLDNSKDWYVKDNILFFNTAICVGKFHGCDIDRFNDEFSNNISAINKETEFKLKYPILSNESRIPRILTNVKLNTEIIKKNADRVNSQTIFYYNMGSVSGQLPLYDHDKILTKLINKFPEFKIIIPKPSKLNNIPNLIRLDDTIAETANGKNLLYYSAIAGNCPYVIVPDTGGALFCLCYENMTNKIPQKILYINLTDRIDLQNKLIIRPEKQLISVPFNESTLADDISAHIS